MGAPLGISVPASSDAIPLCREALALAGVQPERVRLELEARGRAKLQRLYTGHASCVAHAAGSSAAGAATAAAAAAPCAAHMGSRGAAAASSGAVNSSCEQPGTCATAASVPATPMAAPAVGTTSPGAGGSRCGLLGPGGEPERGSVEWLAAQAAYEDAHLGQFQRIMPPADPELVRWVAGAAAEPCRCPARLGGH